MSMLPIRDRDDNGWRPLRPARITADEDFRKSKTATVDQSATCIIDNSQFAKNRADDEGYQPSPEEAAEATAFALVVAGVDANPPAGMSLGELVAWFAGAGRAWFMLEFEAIRAGDDMDAVYAATMDPSDYWPTPEFRSEVGRGR